MEKRLYLNMYLEYWSLNKPPFSNVPGESFFYPSPQHEEAFSRLLYVIEQRRGVAMLTGEVGCGKTTVTKALMKSLDEERYQLLMISNPAVGPLDLIRSILLQCHIQCSNGYKSLLLDQLQQHLVRCDSREISTVLAIDEAHVISRQETLDELRMLLNLQFNEQFLITLILLGQPPLLKRISEIQPLKERISVKYHLQALDEQNTLRYIMHRLKSAGAHRGFFTTEAIDTLYQYSGGIPLRINNVCDRCLLIGFMQKARVIDTRIASEAIDDIQ